MSQKTVDAGHLLDFSAWTGLHKFVLVLSALAIVFDGFDIQVLAFAIPALVKEWHVDRAAFAPILAGGMIAMSAGSALAGLVGDRIGRKKALIGSVVLFGVCTLATAFVHTLAALAVLRFVAGAGLGGAVPNAAAISAEFTPLKRRSVAVSMTIVCVPMGGAIAGAIASRILQSAGWQILFIIGGIAALTLAAILAFALPESPRFLVRRPARWPELTRLMNRLGLSVAEGAQFADPAEEGREQGRMWQALFGGEAARNTLCLWMSYLASMFSIYLALNWLPTLLSSKGFGLDETSSGLAYYNFGGVAGALIFALAINRIGSRVALVVACLTSIGSALYLSAIPPATGASLPILALGLHGLFANAMQTTLYPLAAHIYPTKVRAAGVASAVGIGRWGGVMSAFFGAGILAAGPTQYFGMIAAGSAVVLLGIAMITDHIPTLAKARQKMN